MTATLPERSGTAGRRAALAARRYREARRRANRPRLVRAPRRGLAAAGLIAAGWAAGIGLAVCAAFTVLGWAVGAHGSSTSFDGALRAGALVYAASHLAPIVIPGAVFSLLPLGIVVLPVLLTYRAGSWAGKCTDCADPGRAATLTAVAAGTYSVFVGVMAAVGDLGEVHVTPAVAVAYALVVSGAGFGVGIVRGARCWRALVARVPGRLRDGAAAAAGTLAGLAALSGAALTVALAGRLPEVSTLGGQVASGAADGAALLVLGLLYLPTMLVWAGSYLAGAGFVLGGAAVTPLGAAHGLLPAFPALGAVPQQPPPYGPAVMLLPVLAGLVGGAVLLRRSRRGRVLLIDVLVSTALCGAVAGVLALLASGSLGDGRLAHVGPTAWLLVLAVAAEVLLGTTVAVLLGPLVARVHLPRPALPRRGQGRTDPHPAPGASRGRIGSAWSRLRERLYQDGTGSGPGPR